jgi:hypothetical protein
VGIDRPDDADMPSGEHSDRSADRAAAAGDGGNQAAATQGETRGRGEYYADLRAEISAKERAETREPSAAGERVNNEKQAKAEGWRETAELSRWMWGEYLRRWPAAERAPADRSGESPGSWRGEGGKVLDSDVNGRIEAECDRIVDRERDKISPALLDIESQDPDRQLIGFEDRLKGRDRIKEKVDGIIKEFGFSPEEAVSLVPDAIRFTFEYQEARYTQGIWTDIVRLQGQGFKLDKCKNSWVYDQYKGINSQWIEPATGQRFEVQFHTRISFEAKQLTHEAYKRLRTGQPDEFEQMVLEAFQKKVSAAVPVPPGAAEIPDYPERRKDAR